MGMPQPTSRFYISQRNRLHYVDWGNEGAETLLLVHGGGDHCRSWDWTAAELAKDYHVIAPDLRGHGDSAWNNGGSYSIADYVYDISQLLRQRAKDKVTIISHSLGGAISLLFTGSYPEKVRSLIAIEGTWQLGSDVAPIGNRMPDWIESVYAIASRVPRKYKTIEDATGRMQERNGFLTPAQALHLTIHGIKQNEDGTYSWKFDNYSRVIAPNRFSIDEVTGLWSRITCPMLLVHGNESWLKNPETDGALDYFKHAEVVAYDKAGHWPHHDRFDDFLADVRGFLSKHHGR